MVGWGAGRKFLNLNALDWLKMHFRDIQYGITELLEELTSNSDDNQDFANVNRISKKVLDKHAPCKKKYVRANDGPFMTKELRKANMKRTRLKNRFNKNKTNENWTAFKKQRKILRQTSPSKRSYYNRLDPKVVSDSKKFWRTVKPLFLNRIEGSASFTLLENDVVESDNTRVAEILNDILLMLPKR